MTRRCAPACDEAAEGEVVSPANLNAPGQVVIAGHAAAVARAGERAKARGAKRVIPLQVSAPFHCALMQPGGGAAGARAARAAGPRSARAGRGQRRRRAQARRRCGDRRADPPGVGAGALGGLSCAGLTAEGATAFVEVGPGHGAERPDPEDRARRDHRQPRPAGRAGSGRGHRQRGRPAPERAFMMPFDGQVALVTGASRGIGRAIAIDARGARRDGRRRRARQPTPSRWPTRSPPPAAAPRPPPST